MQLFRPDFRQLQRPTKTLRRRPKIFHPPVQFSRHRMEQIVRLEPVTLRDIINHLEARLRSVQMSHGHRTIQRHYRRWFYTLEIILVSQDALPVR